MNRLRLLSLFFLSLSLSSLFTLNTVHARLFTIEKSATVANTKEKIQDIILDFENYCDVGCLYHLSGVKKVKVVERPDANHTYIWMYVEDTKVFKFFNLVETLTAADGTVTIKTTYPSDEEIARLSNKYQLEHFTFFDTSEDFWTLQTTANSSTLAPQTKVTYKGKFTSSAFYIRLITGTINSAIAQTANDFFRAFGVEDL